MHMITSGIYLSTNIPFIKYCTVELKHKQGLPPSPSTNLITSVSIFTIFNSLHAKNFSVKSLYKTKCTHWCLKCKKQPICNLDYKALKCQELKATYKSVAKWAKDTARSARLNGGVKVWAWSHMNGNTCSHKRLAKAWTQTCSHAHTHTHTHITKKTAHIQLLNVPWMTVCIWFLMHVSVDVKACVYMRACMHACVSERERECVWMWVHIYIYTYMSVCLCFCMCVYVCACAYMCVCACVCVCVCVCVCFPAGSTVLRVCMTLWSDF